MPHADAGASFPWLAWGRWLCPVSLLDARRVRASHTQAGRSPCLLADIPTPGRPGSQLARADAIPGSCQLKAGHEAMKQ